MDKSVPAEPGRSRPYHHGDLRNGLLEAARAILEEEDLSQLTLRAVARKAGVSHAAPYRHFPNHEALLVVARRLGHLARAFTLKKCSGETPKPREMRCDTSGAS